MTLRYLMNELQKYLIKKNFFYWKAEIQRERQTKNELQFASPLPKCCNGQDWTKSKLRTQSEYPT